MSMRTLAATALLAGSTALLVATPDRASEVLARARDAIGGEARLKAVTSLSLSATARRKVGTAPQEVWNIDLDILLPDKFVAVREDALGTRITVGMNGAQVIQRVASGWGRRVLMQPPASLEDGAAISAPAAVQRREMVRCLLAYLLTVPEQYGLQFSDGGITEVDGKQADLVYARGPGAFEARLSFDNGSHLVMMTYDEPPTVRAPNTNVPRGGEPIFTSIEPAPGEYEVQVRLTDYRVDDGIAFAHRLESRAGPAAVENWQISRFKVNPSLNPRRFDPK